MTLTSTSWSLSGWEPPDDSVPQPVTVATLPTYRLDMEAGRQTGDTILEKVTGLERVRMEKSLSRVPLL